MTTIGTFTRDGEGFAGTIATLAIKAKASIKPNSKTVENAPDYRVYGPAEGVASAACRGTASPTCPALGRALKRGPDPAKEIFRSNLVIFPVYILV